MYQASLLHARADRQFRTMISTQLDRFRLTMMEWLLLGVVGEAKDGITLSQIAATLDVSQPQVTALMDKVSVQKLVKQKVLREDRRSRKVVLTLRGRRLVDDIEESLSDYWKAWTSDIDPDQLEIYLRTVQAMSERKPLD
jgi:DNA-binding MarR family transcriptional regulator